MPDKDIKKDQQENTTPAPVVSAAEVQQAKANLATPLPQGPKIDTSNAVNNDAKQAIASAVSGDSPAMHTINKTYGNTLEELGKNVGSLVEQGQKAREDDEVIQRRERNMQMISGISDGLASLANLIGVGGYGASNIDLSGAMVNSKLQERFELARKERKADIKDIDDRLEQKRRELLEMQQRFGLAKAEQLQKEKTEAEAARRFNEEMNFKKDRAKVSDSQWQQTFDANKENAAADRDLRKTQITNDYNWRVRQLNQAAEQAGLKGSFPVLIAENEMLDIPKNKINQETIGRIFDQLPKEFKDLAKGKPVYTYEYGEKVATGQYEQPSLEQKLAAIGAASRTDKTIQDELRKLAGTYKPEQKVEQVAQSVSDDDDDDFSSYKVTTTPVSMSYKDNLPGGVAIPLRR